MNLEPGTLRQLSSELRLRRELSFKRDVRLAARTFGRETRSAWFPSPTAILNGDDAAALWDGREHLLVAAEGMRSEFVAADPWFAGFSSVLANVNDIAAMGGRPWAVVDVLFLGAGPNEAIVDGMAKASAAYGVPVVGGHTTRVSSETMLAVAIVGKANKLISGSGARPGQAIVAAIDLDGAFRGDTGNFNAATEAPAERLRACVGLLPQLAEAGLVGAGKDISMAGLCGTMLMLIEASGCGATLDVACIPAPVGVGAARWLTAFPSFGFLLAVEPNAVAPVCARFGAVGVAAARVGEITTTSRLDIVYGDDRATYWDLSESPLTGFGR
jgi:uncharacterized protein